MDERLRHLERSRAARDPDAALRHALELRRSEGPRGTLHLTHCDAFAGTLVTSRSPDHGVAPWPGVPTLPWLTLAPEGWEQACGAIAARRAPERYVPDRRRTGPLLRRLETSLASRLRSFASMALSYERLMVWTGPDLLSQSYAAWVHAVAARATEGLDAPPLCIQHVSAATFPDLDYVDAEAIPELAARPPRWVAGELADDLRAVWEALIAPTPRPTLELIPRIAPTLPDLARGLSHLAQLYPDARSGLSAAELELLAACAAHGRVRRVLGEHYLRVHEARAGTGLPRLELCEAFFDLIRFAGGAHPLVLLEGSYKVKQGWWTYDELGVELTRAGRDVLEGRANALDLIGYDRWIFGVHVTTDGPTWCSSDGALVLRQR